jgi:hypothetical protein
VNVEKFLKEAFIILENMKKDVLYAEKSKEV